MTRLQSVSIFAYTLYLFHILRNLTVAYLGLLGATLFIFFSLLIAHRDKFRLNPILLIASFSWIFGTLLTFIHSAEYGDPAVGVFRLWAAFPLAVIASALATNSIELPARILTIFFLVAAASFPVQHFIGPIEWFAEASERAGGIRFASLAGSLTAYGVGVGVPALAALYFFKRSLGFSIFCALAAGALFSLQKAAIANIVLALIFAWWLRVFSARVLALSGPPLLIFSLFFLLQDVSEISQFSIAFRYVEGIFTSDAHLSNDVSFVVSIADRITALPLAALEFFDFNSLWFGVGAFGGSGALGYPDLPMAHNGLIELILVFGYIVGGGMVSFLLVHFFIAARELLNRRRVAGTEFGFLYSGYVIWFVNYLFSGGGIFHPIGAAVFWLLILRVRYLRSIKGHRRTRLGITNITPDRSVLNTKESWTQRSTLTYKNG